MLTMHRHDSRQDQDQDFASQDQDITTESQYYITGYDVFVLMLTNQPADMD